MSNNKVPLVSIIIPTYNAENYIKKTIDSILSQSFSNFECLIINDGSTDKTLNIIKQYNDKRISIYTIQNSGGPSIPRNIGLSNAIGKYIFIFDSDDLMVISKLQDYINIFETDNNTDLIFSDFYCIDEYDKVIKKSFLAEYQSFRKLLVKGSNNTYNLTKKNLANELIKANFIGTSSIAIKKDKLPRLNLFDETLTSGDDKLAWIELSTNLSFTFIDKTLHSYRINENSISNSNSEKLLNNKLTVLNAVMSSNKQDKTLQKDCRKKRSEYYFSLGYFYVTKEKFNTSRKCYLRSFQDLQKLSTATAIIKTYIAQILHK